MINVGIVGCGYWGPNHIRNFHDLPSSNLSFVCDLDAKKLQQVKSHYPDVAVTSEFGDLLKEDVDAVVIATPVSTHFRLAKEALLHDKHVLIEKPITASSREAAELINLAEKRNLVLMVGHTYEYHPAVDFLREAITNGELGEIYSIDAHRLNLGLFRPDVNVIWDLAPHDLCIMLSLINSDPISISARGAQHLDPKICDIAYLELLFENGAMGHVHVSWLHPRKIREITVVGSKKMAVYDDVSEAEKIHVYDKGLDVSENGDSGAKFSKWPPKYRYGDVLIPYISNAEPLKLECNHFLECIEQGKRPRSDGWAGLRVTSLLEAADVSMANGGQSVKLQTLAAGVA